MSYASTFTPFPIPCFFFSIIRPPPISTLFPYTTLFRSRIGNTAEAANVITFLCSDLASYVSGTAVNIDGGSGDRKSTRLNSSHVAISYAVFCLKKKKMQYGGKLWHLRVVESKDRVK